MADDKMFLGAGQTSGTAIEKAADTTQLADRNIGVTIGGGITPPYPPSRLAAFQEVNGTHKVAVSKKAAREVGFGFEIVPHPRADDPSEAEREIAEEFWFGRDTKWKIGPQGTPSASPTEVHELARQDWHGIGWQCLELLYGSDNELRGLAHVPADEVRVRKKERDDETVVRGHGYVQENDGETVYYGEAGDRKPNDDESTTYVGRRDGSVHDSLGGVSQPANELIFIPNPSPLSKYYGIPDWVAEADTMVADREAGRFNREFFEWDAMGQYFVIVENGKLSEESRETVREMITGLRQEDGRRVATLETAKLLEERLGEDLPNAKIRIEQIQQHSDEDMAFSEFRSFNEHKIAQIHSVPPQLVGRMESANRANSKEAIRDFVKEVIEPRQERYAGRLYRIIHQQILGVDDWTISFHTRGAEDEQRLATIAKTKREAAGETLTFNEVRELVGERPVEGALGEMYMYELASGVSGLGSAGGADGDVAEAIQQAVDERVAERIDELETQDLIEAGAVARGGAEAD